MRIVATIFFIFAFAVMRFSAVAQQKEEMNAQGALQYAVLSSVHIFPNPAVEYLNVTFDEPIARTAQLTVHNVIGNTVEVEAETIDDHEVRLKVKDLPVGYYLLAVRDEETNSRGAIKFVKR